MVSLKSSQMGRWQWSVSLLLLMATMINYMDRQTLANLAVRITDQFQLSDQQYGDLEFVFGVAFACGSLFFGILADIVPVRILYPLVLVAWSAVGFATGLTTGYASLFWCRGLLGFFEAGHWPCALVVTHAILRPSDRALGNAILQSGASLGAILTPLIILALVASNSQPEAWRSPFLIIGGIGTLWAILWLVVVRGGSLARPAADPGPADSGPADSGPADSGQVHEPNGAGPWLVSLFLNRKFWAMVVMVVSINGTWQLIRAWLPKFLQEGRGYPETTTWLFNSAYYIATDVGCLAAGGSALWIARRGLSVHASRLGVYALCAGLSALTCVAATLPASWLLLGILLVVGAGTLGLFPCYYSFTQEIDPLRVGKITGVLSFVAWLAQSPIHHFFGRFVDATGSFDTVMAVTGLAPLAGLLAMLVLWPRQSDAESPSGVSEG